MARICPLFSSSSGNATIIKDGNSSVLIDAGASFKRLLAAAQNSGCDLGEISAVFITHEHSDHIMGLKVLLKNLNIPVIASEKTLETLISMGCVPTGAKTVCADSEGNIGEFSYCRFSTSHDCEGSSGYSFILPSNKKVTVCTDLGVVTDTVREALAGSNAVLFESNHDVEMLKRGPYPPQLKLRILSDKGHLSNLASSSELPALLNSGTTRFILGHLSTHNNLPMLALSSARAALSVVGAEENRDYILTCAKPADNGVTVL